MEHWSITYLRHVLEKSGYSATSLAKLIGVTSTTLTRPLDPNAKNHKRISTNTCMKIQSATGFAFEPFYQPDSKPETQNTLSISFANGRAHISANIDLEGIKELRSKLDAIEALMTPG